MSYQVDPVNVTVGTTGSTTTKCKSDSATNPTTGDTVTDAPTDTTPESTTVETIANTKHIPAKSATDTCTDTSATDTTADAMKYPHAANDLGIILGCILVNKRKGVFLHKAGTLKIALPLALL